VQHGDFGRRLSESRCEERGNDPPEYGVYHSELHRFSPLSRAAGVSAACAAPPENHRLRLFLSMKLDSVE
jgi:hypothetical protein